MTYGLIHIFSIFTELLGNYNMIDGTLYELIINNMI